MATDVVLEGSGHLWTMLREQPVSFASIPDAPRRSSALEYLVHHMLIRDPKQRITLEQILEHPILQRLLKDRPNTVVCGHPFLSVPFLSFCFVSLCFRFMSFRGVSLSGFLVCVLCS